MFRRGNQSRGAGRWFGVAGIIFSLLPFAPRQARATEVAAAVRAMGSVPAAVAVSSSNDGNGAPASTTDGSHEGAGGRQIGDETLLVDVRINGRAIGKIGEFVKRRGTLMVRPSELRDLGFRMPDSLISEGGDLIAISDVRGLSCNLDEKNMVMNITASDDLLMPTQLQTIGRQSAWSRREIVSGTGMTVNYDALGTFSRGHAGMTGSADVRAFSPLGVASSSWLGYVGAALNSPSGSSTIRLDSAYTFADANSLPRYSVGDYITSGLSWTRPIRMGGIQVRSDFSMRPDLVTFPLPTIKGSKAVPSTVEVLANGNLSASSQVAAGPFQVSQLPVVSGRAQSQ